MNEYAPNRRSVLRDTMTDDQWALAGEDDLGDASVDLEDLAAGYVDGDPLPLPLSSRAAYRADMPRPSRRDSTGQGYIPTPPHKQTHWEVEPWSEDLERQHSPRRTPPQPRRAVPRPSAGSNIPLWVIALLVSLALVAVVVAALAIGMIVSLL